MIYLSKKNNSGFTLLEILVSISLLVVIIVGVNRIYLNISNNQKSIIGENFVHSDIEHFLRIATNNIKLAYQGNGSLCSILDGDFFTYSTSSEIVFIKEGDCWEFYLDNGVIKFYNGYSDYPLTSTKTQVLSLIFSIEDNIALGQPIVTILVKAAPVNDLNNYIYAQTSASVNNY